jgi:hypothetical protein
VKKEVRSVRGAGTLQLIVAVLVILIVFIFLLRLLGANL